MIFDMRFYLVAGEMGEGATDDNGETRERLILSIRCSLFRELEACCAETLKEYAVDGGREPLCNCLSGRGTDIWDLSEVKGVGGGDIVDIAEVARKFFCRHLADVAYSEGEEDAMEGYLLGGLDCRKDSIGTLILDSGTHLGAKSYELVTLKVI